MKEQRSQEQYQMDYEKFMQNYQGILNHWSSTAQGILWMAYDCGLNPEWAEHQLNMNNKPAIYKAIINRCIESEDEFHAKYLKESRRELYYLLMREIQQYCVE